MDDEKFYHINKKLLPAKLNFLFFYGGSGAIYPFTILLSKGLGISATALGFTNMLSMGITLLTKPFIGSLVDYFRNIRIFLVGLVLLYAFGSLSILLIPPIKGIVQESTSTKLRLSNNSKDSISVPLYFDNECIKEMVRNWELSCYVFEPENTSETGGDDGRLKEMKLGDLQYIHSLNLTHLNEMISVNATIAAYVYFKDPENMNLSKLNHSQLLHLKCEPDINSCSFKANPSINEYETYQFWTLTCLLIITGLANGNSISLSDVACYEILGERRHIYGQQRLFGTVGWSLACLLSGYLSDYATGDNVRKDYSPGYYIMACLLMLDIFVLYKMPSFKVKTSSSICRDVKKVFQSSEMILFAVGAVLIGCLSAMVNFYELWYLQDIGARQSLLGWTVNVQCLAAEAPFFIISGWLVKKFGCFNCLVTSFAAYALRFGCVSVITNPWWVLLIDITHGFTFSLFQTTMTNFASVKAPEGVEGTIFGIFSGLSSGFGQGAGSLLCGMAFDKFGGRLTFKMASIISGACAGAFILLSRLLNRRSEDRTAKDNSPPL